MIPTLPPARDANHALLQALAQSPAEIQPLLADAIKDAYPTVDEDDRLFINIPFHAVSNAIYQAKRKKTKDISLAVIIVMFSFTATALYFLFR